MAETYKSLKVPEWVYDNAQQIRADLVRCGVEVVPARLLIPKRCPRCQSSLLRTIVDQVSCSCGYRVRVLAAAGEQVGLGVLLGLGIAALSETLDGLQLHKKPPKKKKANGTPKRVRRPSTEGESRG